MNKLFTSIAVASLSLTMAVGVGVAVSQSAKQEATQVNATTSEWELVTSAPSNWSGEYILCNGTSGTVKMMNVSSYSGAAQFSGTDVTVTNSKITADDSNAITITNSIAGTTGKYSVIANDFWIGRNANSNGVDYTATSGTYSTNLDNTISYASGKVAISGNGGRVLTWFASNSNFKYYAASNNNTQLYRKVASSPTITLDKTELNVGLDKDATFTITTASLNENFAISGIDEDYFTATYTPSKTDGEHTVTLHGVALTSTPITLTVSSSGATSKTISISVVNDIVYQRATKTEDISAGKEIIVTSVNDNYVLGTYESGNASPALGCVISSDNKFHSATLPSGYARLTVSGSSSGWTLTDQNSNIYYGESGQNRLKASASATDTWTISIDGSSHEATITSAASSRWIAKNNSSDIFSTYANSDQTEVYIYVAVTGPAIEVEVTSGSTTMIAGESATLTATLINGATGTINWAKSNNNISLSEATGATTVVTGLLSGTADVTASVTDGSTVEPYVVSFTIKGGSATDPYTVEEARAAIDAGEGLVNVYTTGLVSQVDSFSSQYGSITYWISDDGTTTDQLQVYGGLDLNGDPFADISGVMLGDTVTVYGTLKKYGSVYEYDKNNYLTSHTPAAVTVTSIDSITGTLDAVVGAESWDLSELVVNGTLNSGSSQDITNYVTKTTSAVPGSAGTTTIDVVVTAKEGYGTATATIGVSATVREISGPIANGRYYIMNSTKTFGLSAIESAETPNAVNLSAANQLLPFDVVLKDNNTYEISTTIGGTKYYLVCNTNQTSSSNSSIRIISSPSSGLKSLYWVLDDTGVEAEGAYHVYENTVGTTNRYLSYYTDNTTKWDWRGYLNTNNGDPEIQFVAEGTYADVVVDKILASCTSRGASNYDAVAWGEAASEYGKITIANEKNLLINGNAVKDSTVKLERALEQYDYAVSRYEGIDAFITGRTGIYGLTNNASLFAGISTEATTAIIVVVALTSVTAIGAIFFIKRRKYN